MTVGTDGKVTIKGGGSIKLRHDQSITIKDLPAGVTYKVTEVEANQPPYKTTSDGEEGAIPADSTATAAFTNTAQVGSLTVSKTVASGDMTLPFKFTIKLEAPATASGTEYNSVLNAKYPYTGDVSDGSGSTVTPGENTITFTNGEATVYLKHGQSITITGLPAGVTYTVTETAEHYTAKWTGDTNTGTITDGGTATAACTNTMISVTLPETGGPGTAGLALFSTLLCLAGGAIILCARGRRGKARCAHENHY